MAKEKPPVMFLELCEKRKSGFILQGTEGTVFEEQLDAPTISWIPSSGMMCVKEQQNGVETNVNKEIRFIKNCSTIDVEEQNRRNVKPNRYEDKIPFEKGFATVVRDSSTIELYDYLEKVYYNESNPDRSLTADPIFRVVKLDEKAQEIGDEDELMADAIKFVSKLRVKTGNSYQYNEERLNAICEVCQVFAETPALKLHALMSLAKNKPKWFLDLVVKFEQTISIEVAHALELNLIKFDGNTAVYANGDKIIKNFGAGNISHPAKIEKLADFLKSKEGNEALTELRAKIEFAKEQLLK